MLHYKATTYEQMEKKPKEKKFNQNEYEEVRKLIEQNEGNETVNEIKVKNKAKKQENIKFNSTLFDQLYKFNFYYCLFSMETFAPEDILIDNLSFKLNKGGSYIVDRRSVSFFPTSSNVYKPSSGARVLQFSLNGEDNTWLDPQSVRIFFTLNNKDGTNFKKSDPYHHLIPSLEECVLLLAVRFLKTLTITIVFIICFLK